MTPLSLPPAIFLILEERFVSSSVSAHKFEILIRLFFFFCFFFFFFFFFSKLISYQILGLNSDVFV